MRLLVVNPNTSADMTSRLRDEALAVAAPGTRVQAVNGRFGVPFISSRAELAVAGHAALDALAERAGDYDAAVLACFCDAGVAAAREAISVPVVGMAQAAMHVAALAGGRFAIATIGDRARAMTAEMVQGYGMAQLHCATRIAPLTPAAIAADRAGSVQVFADIANDAVERDGAEAVILGGAAMAGMAAEVQPRVGVPIISPLACAVLAAEALVRLALPAATAGSMRAPPGKPVHGLAPGLAALLGQGRGSVR